MLSLLWLFATLNYLYCDVLGFYEPGLVEGIISGNVSGMPINELFLIGAAVLMTIPISLVLLSRVLPYSAARWVNIIGGTIMTGVHIATLFTPFSLFYLYFSIIEIATTAFIVWYAATWRRPA